MPPRPRAGAAAAIAALALFTVWITWRAKALELGELSHKRATKLTGQPAPAFTLASLDGRTVSLADFHGRKKVVVNFWASWCGPCRMEMPLLRTFYQRTHGADSDYEFLAVSVDEDRPSAEAAAAELKMPFPVLLDLASKTADTYQVESIPTLFVIDKNGKVIFVRVGFDMGVEVMLARQLGIQNYTPQWGAPVESGH